MEDDEEFEDLEDEDDEDFEDVLKPFSFADEIFGYAERLRNTLIYFVVLAIFLVLLAAWFAFGRPSLAGWDVLLYGYGFLVALYFPVAIWNSVRLIRPLGRWMDDYFDFAFALKFELLPAEGATPTERILNKLTEVYPEVADLRDNRPGAIRRESGLRKGSTVRWDLVVDLKHPRLFILRWIHRFFGTPRYILVQRYEQDNPVDVMVLSELGRALRRDLRWSSAEVYQVFVLSAGGFTEEAIGGIEKEEIEEISAYPVELVEEEANGYVLPAMG